MLSERTLSESDLESLDISSYYNGSNDIKECSPLKKRSLRSYCYCCLGSSFYISSCIIFFYIGVFTRGDYEKSDHCNKTIWELFGITDEEL
jgi:hypothetical protein